VSALPIILAGGGTAGHTSPLIATAERLRELGDVDMLCIGTPKGLESRVIPAAGLPLALIPPVPLPRRITPELFSVPGRLGRAVAEAGAILRLAVRTGGVTQLGDCRWREGEHHRVANA